MAIRVRKLARQLKRPPVELLGILKSLGFDRYKSPEDMLSGTVEKKLRTAIREGVRPVPVIAERVRKKPVESAPAPTGGLFPGVVRQHDGRFDAPPQSAPPQSVLPQSAPPPSVTPSEPSGPDPAVLRATLEAERAVVEANRRALVAEREALAAERSALLSRASQPTEAVGLATVLERRGLLGADEAERAIRALAGSRRMAEVLPYLSVTDPEALLRWLQDVLVLVDGTPPEALANEAMVSVSSERADIPGAVVWRRLASTLSEKLLLNGARRVLVVGGSVRAHRLLRQGLDPRVDIRFRPCTEIVAADAEADVTRTDAVALWNVHEHEAATEVYDTGRALVARSSAIRVQSFVEDWIRALTR